MTSVLRDTLKVTCVFIRGGGRPKILVWQTIVNLSDIGMADCGTLSGHWQNEDGPNFAR